MEATRQATRGAIREAIRDAIREAIREGDARSHVAGKSSGNFEVQGTG